MTSSHAGTPQARAKIHTTLTDFEIALVNWRRFEASGNMACCCACPPGHVYPKRLLMLQSARPIGAPGCGSADAARFSPWPRSTAKQPDTDRRVISRQTKADQRAYVHSEAR